MSHCERGWIVSLGWSCQSRNGSGQSTSFSSGRLYKFSRSLASCVRKQPCTFLVHPLPTKSRITLEDDPLNRPRGPALMSPMDVIHLRSTSTEIWRCRQKSNHMSISSEDGLSSRLAHHWSRYKKNAVHKLHYRYQLSSRRSGLHFASTDFFIIL